MSIGKNIARLRKGKGWTQAELGERLGVSNQAVSKWESEMSMPDIMLLPTLADAFNCYIDELFSREVKTETSYYLCTEFPWADDSTIRGVVCEGRKILQINSIVDRFTFEIKGDAKNVQSECNIKVNGDVLGTCSSGGDIHIEGSICGTCNTDGDIVVGKNLTGTCNTDGDITCGGNLSGNVSCEGDLTVRGAVKSERIEASEMVAESIEAERIDGNVVCNSIKCEKIEGDVTIKTKE
ncbi:MAG: helix-turn-helix domain-containing protein [Ruminococcaceae bacterium]|nr:helix-turn-helix domain-containing protein [Oscillospiraceae bacterium]